MSEGWTPRWQIHTPSVRIRVRVCILFKITIAHFAVEAAAAGRDADTPASVDVTSGERDEYSGYEGNKRTCAQDAENDGEAERPLGLGVWWEV